jgi:hypothetical protein
VELRCVAPIAQQNLRDLRYLPELADEVSWLGWEDLRDSPEVAVICGLALREAADALTTTLQKRSRAGLATVLVPRLLAQDLGPLLEAPTPIRVCPGETSETAWEDGEDFMVSAITHVETSLPTGRLGKTKDDRTTVFAYRRHTTAGPTVICTPTVCGRALGVERMAQENLFRRILSYAQEESVTSPSPPPDEVRELPAASLSAYLAEEGPQAALILLSVLATSGSRATKRLHEFACSRLGSELAEEEVERLVARLPSELQAADLVRVLREAGWTAYVRRVQGVKEGERTNE